MDERAEILEKTGWHDSFLESLLFTGRQKRSASGDEGYEAPPDVTLVFVDGVRPRRVMVRLNGCTRLCLENNIEPQPRIETKDGYELFHWYKGDQASVSRAASIDVFEVAGEAYGPDRPSGS